MKYRVLGGSAIGGSHLNTATNGQDAFSVRQSPDSLVIAVADGCGSHPHSGVGAQLMVHICTNYFAQAVRRGQDLTDIRVRRNIRKRLSGRINELANEMAGDDAAAPVINEHFLFTLIVMVMTETLTYFMRIGDGMYGYNDKTVELEPTKGNRPVYLAYDITSSPMTDAEPALLEFELLETVPTAEITTFWIGTDGMQEIFDAASRGVKVGGMPVETAVQIIGNPEYHDGPTNALSARLAGLVDYGSASDDVTFVGGYVEVASSITPDEDDLADTLGKASADDSSADSAGPEGAGESETDGETA